MKKIQLNKTRQLLAVAMGFVFSASAMAAVTSAPTGTVKGRMPVMATPTVDYTDADANGLVNAGDTLIILDGAITDPDNDTPITSTYKWMVDGVAVGTGDTYQIEAADRGKRITAEAVPRTDDAITDPSEGLAVLFSGGTADPDNNGEISIPGDGEVLSVAISGFVNGAPQVGTPLVAVSTCEGGTCGTLTYQWQRETAQGSGVFADISGETNDTYLPVRDDQKLKIQVVVSN